MGGRRLRLLALAVASTAAFTTASPVGADDETTTPAPAPAVELFAFLNGEAEVPGPGDPDGYGRINVRIIRKVVCVMRLDHENIDVPIAMHIHRGVESIAGPIVVDLTEALTTQPHCVRVGGALAEAIVEKPWRFYVNVHTDPFKAGAIRGKLRLVESPV